MANQKTQQELEELLKLYKEEKCELQNTIDRSKDRIKELDAKIDAVNQELSGQTDLFEGLMD